MESDEVIVRVAAVVLAVLIAGCRHDPSAKLSANLARYNRYLAHQWGDSIATMYAPDGVLAAPGREPIRGPEAIAAFLASFTDVRVDSSAMWADSTAATDSGVVQWGGFYQEATPRGQPRVTAHGHIRAEWREQADGRWLLHRLETY